MVRIDASGLHYKELNEMIRKLVDDGEREIILDNVCGQRYIGSGLREKDLKITINGVPGNDLAAFMDGSTITVNSNAQDGVGNTMNSGKIVIHGDSGDITGHSMRGGKIFIKESAGYRVGIHMKSFKDNFPVVVVGGFVRDFLAEYMAGGLLIVLGLEKDEKGKIVGNFAGTGMHGGEVFIRGNVDGIIMGKEVGMFKTTEDDMRKIESYIHEFCEYFELNPSEILSEEFVKLKPLSHRPYGRLYAY
ncbi:MAG TPA: hypothetical protein ENG58_03220 [Thermotogales bacterium]|nr:hypothetical protein [Thermotogales bacterium]